MGDSKLGTLYFGTAALAVWQYYTETGLRREGVQRRASLRVAAAHAPLSSHRTARLARRPRSNNLLNRSVPPSTPGPATQAHWQLIVPGPVFSGYSRNLSRRLVTASRWTHSAGKSDSRKFSVPGRTVTVAKSY
eukprot:3780157-Rhodomonas_salina.3